MKNTDAVSIGVFNDGGYLHSIIDYVKAHENKTIRIKGLLDFIRKKIQMLSVAVADDCQITDVHYFKGRLKAVDAKDLNLLYSERLFEDELIQCEVIFHYRHIRMMQDEHDKKNSINKEKEVYVWYALETYELSQIRHYNYVVLLTRDADHEMLIKKIKATKSKVALLTWKTDKSNASSTLVNEINYHVENAEELEQNKDGLKYLFK